MIKALDLWLPAYLKRRRPAAPVTDLMFCVCDHFEPLHHTDEAGALRRLENWRTRFPEVAAAARDADGLAPKHTFFYPIEQYVPQLLEPIEPLCREHGNEVEIHLHHDNDTAENLRSALAQGITDLRRHGFLGSDASGRPAFGFIHGNWVLDDSHPEGRHCGVRGELAILKQSGCYADFTMPSAPDRSQTRRINSIYYARSTPHGKSHDDGAPVRVGGDLAARTDAETLLLVQGPLGLNWKWRKWKVLPRIENADLTGENPPTPLRLAVWRDLAIHVEGRPEWLFVKLHTHGAVEKNSSMLLGRKMADFHRRLAATLLEQGVRLHYVTARELVNIVHAAEEGRSGDAGAYRDFLIAPPPIRTAGIGS